MEAEWLHSLERVCRFDPCKSQYVHQLQGPGSAPTHHAFPIIPAVCLWSGSLFMICVHSCLFCLIVTLYPHFYFLGTLQRHFSLICHKGWRRDREGPASNQSTLRRLASVGVQTHTRVFSVCCALLHHTAWRFSFHSRSGHSHLPCDHPIPSSATFFFYLCIGLIVVDLLSSLLSLSSSNDLPSRVTAWRWPTADHVPGVSGP